MWLKPLFAHTSKNAKSGLRKWLEVLPVTTLYSTQYNSMFLPCNHLGAPVLKYEPTNQPGLIDKHEKKFNFKVIVPQFFIFFFFFFRIPFSLFRVSFLVQSKVGACYSKLDWTGFAVNK
jgi:hypothetical protein